MMMIIIIIINKCAQERSWNSLKCKDPIIEIQRLWNVKAEVILVIIGAAGSISESLRQYLSNIPGKNEIKGLQINSHIEHCTQTAGSADVKVQNIFRGRNNITCSTDCKHRQLQHYMP